MDMYTKQKDVLAALKPVLTKYATDTEKKVEVLYGAQAYFAEVGYHKGTWFLRPMYLNLG